MSSKKRLRSQDSTTSSWSNGSVVDKEAKIGDQFSDSMVSYDHEMVFNAFEKPTQIYRYLRTRLSVSILISSLIIIFLLTIISFKPIFLYRSLSYMRHRLCRSKTKRRRDFSVDSLLQYVCDKKQREAIDEESSGNLSLSFMTIKNQNSNKDTYSVTLEISLLKMGHQKRKDVMQPIYQFLVSKTDININDEESEENCVTILKNELNEINSHIVKQWSYSLLFIASFSKKSTKNFESVGTDKLENGLSFNDLSEENPKNEVPVKKRRLDETEEILYYKSELMIYDKHRHCLLTDGEYKVVLLPCSPPKISNRCNKYNKFSSWQQIDAQDIEILSLEDPNKVYDSMDVFRKGPVLSFQLSWSSKLVNIVNGLNQILSNDNENDSGIGNNTSDNSSQLSYNGVSNTPLKTQRANSLESGSSAKRMTRVVYQFLFNNNTRQQTKPQNDLCCPWCSLNCQRLYSLIKHLKLCHNRFTFTYVPDLKCARIDVSINECYDGSYAGNPHDLSFSNIGFAFSRNGPVRRNPVTHVIVCRPKRFPNSLSEFDEPDEEEAINARITGHNRLYYHTNSCLPIRPQEMDFDSEAENDPKWLKEKTQLMIDEFTDVNEGEKEVMKMWNLHIMKNGFVGDCQIQLACLMFVEEKGLELIEKNLYKNFILHLNNLYDFGLLNAASFVDVVKKLDQKQKSCQQKSFDENEVKLELNSKKD